MGFGAIIIGDEIIRGKRPDGHFAQLVKTLAVRGLTLDWAMYAGDSRTRLTETLRRTMAGDDVVFSYGGIGATPDDHTRQAAAEAAGLELELNAFAEKEIRLRVKEAGIEIVPGILQMGEFPVGADIIPNPYNGIPGFSLHNHYFVPGFPQMAWPMIEWVLDTNYADLFQQCAEAEDALMVWDNNESTLLPLMLDIESRYAGIKVFSLPSFGDEKVAKHIELGVRGEPAQVVLAMNDIRAELTSNNHPFSEQKK
jgi:hypothetical protein